MKGGRILKIDTVKLKTQVIEFFNHLHKNPEISWEEHNTSSFIAKVLQENNFTVTSFEQNTGVVGVIGSGKPVVALRADMDALWQEVDGQFQANHSCGHDAHMAMVLGVVVALNEMETLPNGTIKVIFQPAEEVG